MTKTEKLEQKILAEFKRMGFHATDCQLRAAQGHWRTDWRADVYRFEGTVVVNGHTEIINSWNTMTSLLKTGIEIVPDDGDWMVNPLRVVKG